MEPHTASLGELVEEVLGAARGVQIGWEKAVFNWRRLEIALDPTSPGITLQEVPAKCWLMISEWFSGALLHPELKTALQTWIQMIECGTNWPPQAHAGESKLAAASQYYEAPSDLLVSRSVYHAKLFELFELNSLITSSRRPK